MKNGLLLISALTLVLSTSAFSDSMTKKHDIKMMDKVEKGQAAFGGTVDVAYSKYLWVALEATKLNSTPATLYVGGPPHGKVREVLESTIDGQRVIVKRNYGGAGVSIENVKKDRAKYLKAVTVMIQKEGYNPSANDWYWVKYKADGTLHTTPKKDLIAGKFPGCIGCHSSASGNDLVFAHNKDANADITLVDALK